MSFRAFDVPTMIAISDTWVADGPDKALLESSPLTAGLVPILASAHQDLLRLRLAPSEPEASMRSLSERAFALDREYDSRYRGLRAILTGCAAVSNDARRGVLDNLRDTLLPDDLEDGRRNCLDPSGRAALPTSKLTEEDEQTLRDITVEGKSLLTLYSEWVQVGRRLCAVERERARITEEKAHHTVSAKDVLNAGFKWIRAVGTLAALLDLDSNIPQEARLRILAPLRAAEEKIARKRIQSDPTESLDPTKKES